MTWKMDKYVVTMNPGEVRWYKFQNLDKKASCYTYKRFCHEVS